MDIIKDIITPIMGIANKSNVKRVEYEIRTLYEFYDKSKSVKTDAKENGIKIWIYADADEDIKKEIASMQYDLVRKYHIGIDVVIVPLACLPNKR